MARKISMEYKNKLEDLMRDLGTFTVERLRKEFINYYARFISWNTVRHHLDNFIKEGLIEEQIVTKGQRRTISFFKVKE